MRVISQKTVIKNKVRGIEQISVLDREMYLFFSEYINFSKYFDFEKHNEKFYYVKYSDGKLKTKLLLIF